MGKCYWNALLTYFQKFQEETPSVDFLWNKKNKQLVIQKQKGRENKVIFQATPKEIFVILKGDKTRFSSWFSAYKAVNRAFDYCYYNVWSGGECLSPPKLGKYQISVCHIETNTGTVLTLCNDYHLGWGEVFYICENQKQAEEYAALRLQQSDHISFVLHDAGGNAIKEVGPF
ncbi:hypothetical protein [Candidatus Uabimicrobium sp. HlEnr_7]|uniref:hypothetical protein n=1 Tax=Candidatus Uabimicrobium helgolandensis TaxID=3095367 RepID=UPI00355733EC